MNRGARSRSPRLCAAACWLACIGCDQFAAVGVQHSEISNAGAPSPPAVDAGAVVDHDAAPVNDDAGTFNDAGMSNDAGSECKSLAVADCNPVKNEGCSAALMMQCAVNFDAPLTGYCIFNSGGPPPAFGGACLNSGITESCPPTSTCVAEQCRELCFCDNDCEAGQCCTEPLESTGFKICGDC